MTLPLSRSGHPIPPAILAAAREMVEPVRRAGDAAVKRLQRRLRDDPELRDVPVEVLTAAVLDLLTPVIREELISGLLENAQAQGGKIRAREWMGYLTGASRQAVEQKFGLLKQSGKQLPVPSPRSSSDQEATSPAGRS